MMEYREAGLGKAEQVEQGNKGKERALEGVWLSF